MSGIARSDLNAALSLSNKLSGIEAQIFDLNGKSSMVASVVFYEANTSQPVLYKTTLMGDRVNKLFQDAVGDLQKQISDMSKTLKSYGVDIEG